MDGILGNGPKGPIGITTENIESIKIEWASNTLPSEKNPDGKNEDAVLADSRRRLFAIFDGMGGHAAGDVASRLAKKAIAEYFLDNNLDISSIEDLQSVLSEALTGANSAIIKYAREHPEHNDTGTTVSAVKIFSDKNGKSFAVVGNVGDSRVYKLSKDGELTQITIDDDELSVSPYSREERITIAKKLAGARRKEELNTTEQIYFNNRRHITQALGRKDVAVALYRVGIQLGDRLLITSDGVHDNLTTNEIKEIVGAKIKLENIAKQLTEQARTRSRKPKTEEMRAKPDDMSVIVVEIK